MSKPIHLAYERCKQARDALHEVGRCIEAIEDKAGILVERYVIGTGASLVLYATPSWWDVFATLDDSNSTTATLAKIRAAREGAT